jgi:fructose-specific PTS system IIA-like component
MRIEHDFVCTLANGLHARPASLLAQCAESFHAIIQIRRRVTPEPAPVDIRSVLSIIGLDVREGDRCTITATGDDADAAIAALREVIELRLDAAEQAADAEVKRVVSVATRVPRVLRQLSVRAIAGESVCHGAAIGEVVILGGLSLPVDAARATATSIPRELAAARAAIDALHAHLAARANKAGTGMAGASTEAAILAAHAQIASDPALWDSIRHAITAGATAPQAVVAAADSLVARLRAAESAYVRDRAIDVQDIAMQLVERLLPGATADQQPLARDSIVFAEALTANQLLRLDRAHLKGLVLGSVGKTSHTVILARGFGIPCVINVAHAAVAAPPGDLAAIDGDGGYAVAPATPDVVAYFAGRQAAAQRRAARLRPLSQGVPITRDGHRLEVGTNASSAAEVAAGIAHGSDGIGLFRTEFMFLERDLAPDEDEQLAAYADAVREAAGAPVIFRTFDIGGDKLAPYLHIDAEENPFLGVRGIRLHQRYPALLDIQLRAIIRAAAAAPVNTVRVMAPMVATPAEAAWFRDRVLDAITQVRAAGHAAHDTIPIGVMIEVPAAAMSIDLLAPHVDFFSIGTNDLCQYALAADRGNAGVATLNDPLHPAFLRLLRLLVRDANAAAKWIGVCGEMGGRVTNVALLIGLGVNEISGSSANVLALKQAIRAADASQCRAILDAACACADSTDVVKLLNTGSWRAQSAAPSILDLGCIEVDVDLPSKAHAIEHAVELLWIAGRTNRPRDVDAAAWAREETYSTGLGHGFAIPHCKSDAVQAATLVVVKLRAPIEWGSMDNQPVHTVMLLAVPTSGEGEGNDAAKQHMKIFASLARKLMHEEFRDALVALHDPAAIEAFMKRELGLA